MASNMADGQQWALVTGASGGLGGAFATALAAEGRNLILTARDTAKLEALGSRLSAEHGVKALVIGLDLSAQGSAKELMRRVAAEGVAVDILVNNAGFGVYGELVSQAPDRLREMLELNVVALTELTRRVAAEMAARRQGSILLVSSMTAHQPVPTYSAYAASKAYVLSFGEALHAEMAKHGVKVTVLSPGLMDTGFLAAAGQAPTPAMRRTMLAPDAVVAEGLKALVEGKPSVIAGAMNRILAFSNRFTPRKLQANVAYKMMAP